MHTILGFALVLLAFHADANGGDELASSDIVVVSCASAGMSFDIRNMRDTKVYSASGHLQATGLAQMNDDSIIVSINSGAPKGEQARSKAELVVPKQTGEVSAVFKTTDMQTGEARERQALCTVSAY